MPLYNQEQVQEIFASGQIAYKTHMCLLDNCIPGISTLELDKIAEEFIRSFAGAKPAFLGYHGYPFTICTSINSEVVHGLPSKEKVLNDGDILSIDLGVNLNGYYSDTAWTWPIGKILPEYQKLIEVTQESLYRGIDSAIPNNRVGDIGFSVQSHVESNNFSVVRDLVGHGIGKKLHEEPQIPNYGKKKSGEKLSSGMVIAIEPMVNIGSYSVVTDPDKWTIKSLDSSYSAHFEHTLAITAKGPKICTLPESVLEKDRNVFEILSKKKIQYT